MPLLQRRDRKLTAEEKEFARRFRDAAQAKLTESLTTDPPTYQPPNFLAIFRHKCSARTHRESTAMQLKEVYVSSIDYIDGGPGLEPWRGHALEAERFDQENPDHVNGLGEVAGLPLLGFIYREGECAKCKDTSRSPAGRLVLSEERPPTTGKMAR